MPKVLTIDIETSPHLGHVWSLWQQNVSLSQLKETGQVISFAAKWYGKKAVEFRSDHHDGHEAMVLRAHELFNEADVIVHYNGVAFDIKHLKREFILAGLTPPSPHKDIDLLRVVKSQFKFASNKLDFVAQQLGLGAKTHHTGFQLWLDCMAGDDKAWSLMRKYNKQDVVLTEALYDHLRPWITSHPHVGLWTGEERSCGKCGGTNLVQDGRSMTAVTTYARYRCEDCGGWSRANYRKGHTEFRGIR